jgi:hypothetical protein
MVKKNKQNKQTIAKVDGQGNYYTDRIVPVMQQLVPKGTFANFGRNAGSIGGTALGLKAGRPILGGIAGRAAGGFLGNGLSRILGFGDYKVQSNSIFKESMAIAPGESVPSFGMIGQETRVRHREFIKDVVVPATPTAFSNTAYTINAGDTTTFPWLAALAANYQQYKVNGMVFEFKTLSSDITSGGALGAVILATNYDVTEIAFQDKLHMENSQYAVSAKPSQSQIHTIECDPALTQSKMLYVRDASSATTNVDARISDLGKFQLATVGLPGSAGAVLGELWVSYDVSLYKPEIAAPGAAADASGSKAGSAANLFSTDATVLGLAFTLKNNTVTYPFIGKYLLELRLNGTGIAAPTFASSTASVTALTGDSVINTASTLGVSLYLVNITSASQTVVFDATGSTTVSVAVARTAAYSFA